MKLSRFLMASVMAAALSGYAAEPGVGSGTGVRYATDAYPGFDLEGAVFKPEKKGAPIFSCFFGPKKDNAADQFAWAAQLESEGSVSGARRAYDALVREWPTAPEASGAQLKVAKLYGLDGDYEESFKEYRYLLDFYSSSCDFTAVSGEMYKLAELMRQEGKTIIFFNFRNTVDVRRAYEQLVLRAPGAAFVPKALLTIAGLREDEDHLPEAVKVYENLRNLYPESQEAVEAAYREGRARMDIVRRCEYNRNRVRDTADYLRRVVSDVALPEEKLGEMRGWIAEAEAIIENDFWNSARFYDSRTRTRRSAINAYEVFLKDYPDGVHAEEARARIEELKNGGELK